MRSGMGMVAALVLALAPPASAAGDVAAFAKEAGDLHGAGAIVANQVAEVTGVSLSPVVGMSALGAWRWYRTPETQRARLPWHQQPWFWGAGLLLLAMTFLADKVPGLRTVVKSVRLYENKVFGLLAAAVMLENVVGMAAAPVAAAGGAALRVLAPVALAADGAGGLAAAAPSALSAAGVGVLGLLVIGAVWLLGHAIDVLVLVSPFAPLDLLLRAVRNGTLVILAAAAALSPTLGAALAVPVILVALLLAGWTFRLCVFGAVMSADFLRCHRVVPAAGEPIAAFATNLPGVPRRSYGRVELAAGGAAFSWRPWLVLGRRGVPLPGPGALGVGLVSPVLLAGPANGSLELARLPPRYRGAEIAAARALGGLPVVDVPLVRGLKAAWARMRGAPQV